MWFTETPWPPILICSVIAILFAVVWYAKQRAVFLLGVPVMLVCGVAIYFVEQSIVTEAELVEAAVLDLAETVERGDTEETLSFISANATALRLVIGTALTLVTVEDDLRITDLNVTMMAQNSRAKSHFRANGSFTHRSLGATSNRPTRWELTWQREGGEWKIVKVDMLDPITGEKKPFLGID